jgi:hypothetical protein
MVFLYQASSVPLSKPPFFRMFPFTVIKETSSRNNPFACTNSVINPRKLPESANAGLLINRIASISARLLIRSNLLFSASPDIDSAHQGRIH